MSIAAALGSPSGSAITRFVIGRVAPAVAAATVTSPLAVPLLVGGGILAAQAAWYYWGDDAMNWIRDKARERYSALNPNDTEMKATLFDVYGIHYSDCSERLMIPNLNIPAGYYTVENTATNKYCGHYQNQFIVNRPDGTKDYLAGVQNAEAFPFTRVVPKNQTAWDKLSEDKRRAAIDLLTTEDWKEAVGKMLQGGMLSQGQILADPAMLLDNGREIPGGSRVLTADQAAIVEGVLDRLKPYQDKVDEIAAIVAAAGLVGVGASVAANTGAINNLGDTVRRASEATNGKVDAMKAEMNNNFNEVKKRFKSIASFLNFDRILNLLIWWQTLHNAFMLSADLSRSLVSAFSTALKALPGDSLLGLPTESADGSPLDLATTINKSIEGWIKGAIGTKNYKLMALELAQINRIYQSTANISSDVTSIFDSFRQPLALGIERISIVANALRRNGVVRDDSYSPMSEKVNIRSRGLSRIDRVTQGLEALSNATSAIESVASNVISIQEEVTEIKKYRKEYEDEKTKLSKEIERKETDSKKTSSTPDIKEEDETRHAA